MECIFWCIKLCTVSCCSATEALRFDLLAAASESKSEERLITSIWVAVGDGNQVAGLS
jgi:hypothetical protein